MCPEKVGSFMVWFLWYCIQGDTGKYVETVLPLSKNAVSVPSAELHQAEKVPSNMLRKADSDHPAHAQCISRVFALHLYIVYYPEILLADCEGPDHTAWMHRLF